MQKILRVLTAASIATAFALPAVASAQTWANWTSANVGGNVMSGTLGATTITYNGGFDGYQLSDGITRSGVSPSGNCGYAFFCLTAPYTSAGVNAPTNDGFIQYTGVHRGTITFGSAVVNPLIAFISVGQGSVPVRYNFLGESINVLSDNSGSPAAWGTGSQTVSGSTITGNEFSGTVQLIGTFSSFSYSVEDAENWHGVTVGVQSVVPEPSTYALMFAGLFSVGIAARRRRTA